MIAQLHVRELRPHEIGEHIDALVALSHDAVDAGAQLGWERPLHPFVARTYWESRINAVEDGECTVFAAFSGSRLVGTVQLERGHFEMSRHRGEVAKLMVHTEFRRQGIALRLMSSLEHYAYANGIELLVLDTRPGEPVEQLYQAIGYTATGFIPNWLRGSDGTYRDNVFYFKLLAAA